MKTLYLDIETLPADESSRDALKFIYDKRVEKKLKRQDLKDEIPVEVENRDGFEEFLRGTSFDGGFGRILCIAYAVNDEEVHVLCNPTNEKKTLEDFWFVAGQCDLFVGHNVMDFDLRFILQRSIVLGVKPSWERFGTKRWNDQTQKYLSFARYQHHPIFDTMYEWSAWGNNKTGLEHLALALGIPSPKDGIDGSQVYDFFKAGKVVEICDYCKRDVDTTRAVYKRMMVLQ